MVLEELADRSRSAVIWDPSDLKRKSISSYTLQQMWSGQAILFGRRPWSDSAVVLVTSGILALTIAQQIQHRRRVERPRSAGD